MLSFWKCTKNNSFNVTETASFNMKYVGFCEPEDEREGLETRVAELMEEKNGKHRQGKKCVITVSPKSVHLSVAKEPSKELLFEQICYCAVDTRNTNMFVMNYVERLEPKKQFQCHVFLGKKIQDVENLARLTAKYHQEVSEEIKKEMQREDEKRKVDEQVKELERKMDETESPRKSRDENQNHEEGKNDNPEK